MLARLATDKNFVSLDHTTASAGRTKGIVAHRLANVVRHEPRCFERDNQGAVKLVAADAFLAGADQIDRLKQQVHRNVACLKDGTDLDREWLAALVALVSADPGGLAAHLADPFHAAAVRADRAVSPNALLYIRIRSFSIVELGAGLVVQGAYFFSFNAQVFFLGMSSIISRYRSSARN